VEVQQAQSPRQIRLAQGVEAWPGSRDRETDLALLAHRTAPAGGGLAAEAWPAPPIKALKAEGPAGGNDRLDLIGLSITTTGCGRAGGPGSPSRCALRLVAVAGSAGPRRFVEQHRPISSSALLRLEPNAAAAAFPSAAHHVALLVAFHRRKTTLVAAA